MRDEIMTAVATLKRGGTLLYPTDTVWGLGCDATNALAVDKLTVLKNRPDHKSYICLVSDFKMLNIYVEDIPEVAYDVLKYSEKPTTIIYEKPIRIADNLLAPDGSLGIRVVKDPFCQQLIRKLRKPLVSTSANLSGQPTPKNRSEVAPAILEGVDYVVNLPLAKKNVQPSTVIKIGEGGIFEIIRK